MPPLPRDLLYADLRDNAFGFRRRSARPPSIGAEVELIPVRAEGGAPVPICAEDGGSATLPFLRRHGERLGWREEASPYGAPRFVLPDGGILSHEPGGQIELAAPPRQSLSTLLSSLRAAVLPLARAAREEGIELLSVGIEPRGSIRDLPLQLHGTRYVRMTRFLEAIGTGGTRMMRQTAAVQTSLDWGPDPLATWRLLNALAPYLVAVFANSPVYEGRDTGERSFRARVWRELGGGRTGIFPCGDDPVAEYLEFALDAPALLLGDGEDGWWPFRRWNEAGHATLDDWRAHLTTLFPEARPKGFVEARSPDAVPPEWYAAPLVFLAGMAYHPPAHAAAREISGAPDPALLERAGRVGLRDPRIAARARDLFELALGGAAALGPRFAAPADVEEARAFYDTYTRRGLSPADDACPPGAAPAYLPASEAA